MVLFQFFLVAQVKVAFTTSKTPNNQFVRSIVLLILQAWHLRLKTPKDQFVRSIDLADTSGMTPHDDTIALKILLNAVNMTAAGEFPETNACHLRWAYWQSSCETVMQVSLSRILMNVRHPNSVCLEDTSTSWKWTLQFLRSQKWRSRGVSVICGPISRMAVPWSTVSISSGPNSVRLSGYRILSQRCNF